MKLEINNPLAIAIWNNAQLMKQNDFVAWLLDESESPSQSKETPVAGTLDEFEKLIRVWWLETRKEIDAESIFDFLKPHLSSLLEKKDEEWISAETKPEYNRGVLVFIPEEDNHITAGMWDISNKWVLLDEYREPECAVTHWMEMPSEPEGFKREPLPEWFNEAVKEYAKTDPDFQSFKKQVEARRELAKPSEQSKEAASAILAKHFTGSLSNKQWRQVLAAMHEYAEQVKQSVNEDELWEGAAQEYAQFHVGDKENNPIMWQECYDDFIAGSSRLKQTYSITKK